MDVASVPSRVKQMTLTPKARKRLLIAMSALPLGVVTWFAAVDWSWFVETCPDCQFCRDIGQYRILGYPISEWTREHHTAVQETASELGVECRHPHLGRLHKHRRWGLLICARPCINGLYLVAYEGMGDDSKAAIREMMRRNPHLPAEYASRVLEHHDMQYLEEFWNQARAISVSSGN